MVVKFLNNPRTSNKHKWVRSWKTLWLVHIVKPNYVLEEDMLVELELDGKRYLKTIHKGYECDLASIPSYLWKLWLPDSVRLEAVSHDIDYQSELFERKVCDLFFKEAMIVRGRPKSVVTTFYNAVKYMGWIVWRKHTEASIKEARKFVTLEEIV